LGESDEEKVQIVKEFELLVEDERQEGDDIVLLVAHEVGRER
jgi:hypothetical protein